MSKKRNEFTEDVRIKALLWCDRHCCLCKKTCGVDIEIHHIDPKGSGDIDNAMPLCYDCHAKVGHYNNTHPRGLIFKSEELKARREQIYEEYTRHLIPPLDYRITQIIGNTDHKRPLPDVGFNLFYPGNGAPVRVHVNNIINANNKEIGSPSVDLYSGKKWWNLNPHQGVYGHFSISSDLNFNNDRIEIRIHLTIKDCLDRKHELLPVGWIYMPKENDWYFEP